MFEHSPSDHEKAYKRYDVSSPKIQVLVVKGVYLPIYDEQTGECPVKQCNKGDIVFVEYINALEVISSGKCKIYYENTKEAKQIAENLKRRSEQGDPESVFCRVARNLLARLNEQLAQA